MDKNQVKIINRFGFGFQEIPLKTVQHLTYYKKDGTPLPNLPADPYHLERYLARGLSLEPPKKVAEVMKLQSEAQVFVCDVCKTSFSRKVALIGHSRTHNKSK